MSSNDKTLPTFSTMSRISLNIVTHFSPDVDVLPSTEDCIGDAKSCEAHEESVPDDCPHAYNQAIKNHSDTQID